MSCNWGEMGEKICAGWGMIDEGWRKGPWTAEEDKLLTQYVNLHGEGRWNSVARLTGLKRNGKSCRLRWVNYLRPDLKRGQITPHEESIILELHSRWGNRWSTIARSLPGRTDNEIKNYWRTHFKKKVNLSSDDSGKSKTRFLRRQQFQLQQQQQQQQQQLMKNHVDMNKVISWLEESSESKISYQPQAMAKQDIGTTVYQNTIDEQGYFCSVLDDSAPAPETLIDEMCWDGFWNLDDVHANYNMATTTRPSLPSLVTPLF